MELNQYSLYSIGTEQGNSLTDRVEYIHNKLENYNYDEARKYLVKLFANVQKPGDEQGLNFKRENTGLICQMAEDRTLIVMAKRYDKQDLAWVSVKVAGV